MISFQRGVRAVPSAADVCEAAAAAAAPAVPRTNVCLIGDFLLPRSHIYRNATIAVLDARKDRCIARRARACVSVTSCQLIKLSSLHLPHFGRGVTLLKT